jgi:hypothetical protein
MTATETWVTSSDIPYPNSKISITGTTPPMAMLLGSRRICRVSLRVSAQIRRHFANHSGMRIFRQTSARAGHVPSRQWR